MRFSLSLWLISLGQRSYIHSSVYSAFIQNVLNGRKDVVPPVSEKLSKRQLPPADLSILEVVWIIKEREGLFTAAAVVF